MLHIYLVCEICNWLVEHFSSQIQPFLLENHAVFIKLRSNYARKYAKGDFGHECMTSGCGAA